MKQVLHGFRRYGRQHKRIISIALVLLAFGAVGLLALLSSGAAVPTASIEAENGSLSGGASVVADASAANGGAVKFSAAGAVADDGRFFKMPDVSSSNKLVFAHYFGPYPIRISDVSPSNDFYANNYLRATGEKSKFITTGGLLRDRPLPVAPSGTGWEAQDATQDIAWAKSAGIDGFYVNIMGGTGDNITRYEKLRDVAKASFPGFYVIPMIDANGSLATPVINGVPTDGDPALVAEMIARFSQTSYRLPDNRMLVGTFKIEGKTPAWWSSVWSALQANHAITPAVVGVYNDYTKAGNYTQYASGRWGVGADPNIYATRANYGTEARARNELYQADVWAQDIRPSYSLFDEARGTKALFAAWDRAITDQANMVQICTWSDYSEGSQFRPSAARGSVELDLSAWKIAQYKTGTQPTILKDAVYVSHRNQTSTSTIAGPQTKLMAHWNRPNKSAFQEKVEVLTFLTAPADVTVTVGGVATTYAAAAGMFSKEVDARAGSVVVVVQRSGATVVSHTSPYQIRATVWQQDRQYFMSSSLRSTALQFDPTETDTGQKPTYPTP